MDKNIFEEGPRRGHAAGDTSIEQQASQLAYDIKYKARQKMKGKSGSNLSPGQVQQLYRQLLNSSSAPGGVKAIVKKKLFGEQIDPGIVPVTEHLKSSSGYVYGRVFEGKEERKFVVRVTDRATGNTTYRKADRAKIAELRANKNISSVEITGRKEVDDAFKGDPKPNYGGKKAKKDYDGDGKVESGSKEHAGVVHNAIQRKKGGVADGKDTRKEEYIDEDSRRMSNKQHTKRVRSNIKSFGSNYTPPSNYDPDANRGQGEVLTAKQMEKKRRKALRQEEVIYEKEEYIDEGLRSAVKRLLGGKKKEEPAKPMSRGEQLRKKYNVGPERSDTSAKRKILDKTRARAERDQKQYGGSVYSKRVADKSKAAHDRYLKGGYSKYGADDRRGSGNKARKRAAALQNNEFEWLVDSLLGEGYDLSAYTVDQFYDFCEEVIYEKEDKGDKKLDVMKGKNNVKINPTIGESIRAELNALKSQRVEEAAAAAAAAGPSPEERKQLMNKDKMLKKKIMLQKQTMQMQKQGRLPLNYNEECGCEDACPKCGKMPCVCEKKEGKVKEMDPREIPTRINLTKNKLRAMGLKMSYDMEGEMTEAVYGGVPKKKEPKDTRQMVTRADKLGNTVAYQNYKKGDKRYKAADHLGESSEDRMRDQRQERGGVDGNVDYSRPAKNVSGGKKKSSEEVRKLQQKAVDMVRAKMTAKYGKGAIK